MTCLKVRAKHCDKHRKIVVSKTNDEMDENAAGISVHVTLATSDVTLSTCRKVACR